MGQERVLFAIMLVTGGQTSGSKIMEQKKNITDAAHLERVIEKNQQYLDSVAEDLLRACLGAGSARDVPAGVMENVLKVYSTMRTRLSEIAAIQKLLLQRHHKRMPENSRREKLLADLDAHIKVLSARLGKSASAAGSTRAQKVSPDGPEVLTPSERWLRINEDSLAFTINARLLDELEYEPPAPSGGPSKRQVQASGRSFTLFSIRGPASALDDLYPRFTLRQHDIVERFNASEIRGVLTHLRRTTIDDITHIFKRLLASRFPDVKCILVGLNAPDELDENFLKNLEHRAEEMRPGELRTIDIAKHH